MNGIKCRRKTHTHVNAYFPTNINVQFLVQVYAEFKVATIIQPRGIIDCILILLIDY